MHKKNTMRLFEIFFSQKNTKKDSAIKKHSKDSKIGDFLGVSSMIFLEEGKISWENKT